MNNDTLTRRPHRLRGRRAGAVFLAVVATGAVSAAPASALSIEKHLYNGKPTVSVRADLDATDTLNQVTMTPVDNGPGSADDELVVTDSKATVDEVKGCTKLDTHTVECAAGDVAAVRVILGDGADAFFGAQLAKPVTAFGDDGSDLIFTGSGADTIYDGSGSSDVTENDSYYAGGGADTFHVAAYGTDVISGGAAVDKADFSGSYAAVNVTLDGKANDGLIATRKSNVTVEHVSGTNAGDVLTGDGQNNKLRGGAGADQISGGGGSDVIWGNALVNMLDGFVGEDTIIGGKGSDTLLGGADADVLNAKRDGEADHLDCGFQLDAALVGPGLDTVAGCETIG